MALGQCQDWQLPATLWRHNSISSVIFWLPMDSWQILDLTAFEGYISYRRGQLIVHRDNADEITVSLADLATLLVGLKTSISGAVLQELAAFDVVTLICDWRGVPTGDVWLA